MKHIGLGAVVLAVAMVGCGGTSTPAATVTVTTTTTTTVTATPPTSATATQSPSMSDASTGSDATLKLGQSGTTSDATVTLLQVKRITTRDQPAVAGLAKLCAKTATTTDWSVWAAADTDDGQYQASGETDGNDPLPIYPFTQMSVSAGQCVKGWVVFEVAKGATLRAVAYDSPANSQDQVVWTVRI